MDDLISRQAALDCVTYDMEYTTECIKALPSAQPEQQTGQWIFHETQNDRYDDMICPFCKKTYTVDAYKIDDIGFTAEDFNYCPNCGSYNGGDSDDS